MDFDEPREIIFFTAESLGCGGAAVLGLTERPNDQPPPVGDNVVTIRQIAATRPRVGADNRREETIKRFSPYWKLPEVRTEKIRCSRCNVRSGGSRFLAFGGRNNFFIVRVESDDEVLLMQRPTATMWTIRAFQGVHNPRCRDFHDRE